MGVWSKMKPVFCPLAKTCDFYENWVDQTGNQRLDVIHGSGSSYSCLAITGIQDPTAEGGIEISPDVQARLPANQREINQLNCGFIELLNK